MCVQTQNPLTVTRGNKLLSYVLNKGRSPNNPSVARHLQLVATMLYLFKVRDAPFIKMGFTRSCPWRRIATGFWSNLHPTDCCDKLGWEDLELVAVFPGSLEDEKSIKKTFPPTVGEFWPEQMVNVLKSTLGFLGGELPLPPRPLAPPEVERCEEKLPCCSGQTIRCFKCDKTFHRWHHLKQHLQSHADVKDSCGGCGLKVLKRNLKRHTGTCKGKNQ